MALEPGRMLLHALAAEREHIELDDIDELEQRFRRLAVREVVQRNAIAAGCELGDSRDQLLVEQLVLEQLEPDLARRERLGEPVTTKSLDTLIQAMRSPTIRSRPISVNASRTTFAVAPSGVGIAWASLLRNSSS
jgi:hypothetical protein